MKILATGATGLIGRALCRRLATEGHQLVVLSRRPDTAGRIAAAEVFGWQSDLGPPDRKVWEGVEAVIHLAGEPVAASRWTEERKRRIRDSRVRGTRHLIEGIKESADRPKILVSASAVGYYGDRGNEVLNEAAGVGRGFLPDVCQQWESEALQSREMGLRVVLVRIGVVLSADGGALEKMLLPFKLGLGGRMGDGRQWFPWIHIDDIAGLFCHALFSPGLSGPLNGVAPGIVDNEEFTAELASVLRRPAIFSAPEFFLKIIVGEMAEVVLGSQRVIPGVALESGYQFRFPHLKPALENLLTA
ncbi:MAG: TIGR01777 family oxidoreductase [Blastocatellia bacterium]|nr:TIGR01777 family oxidoreductase [Blastocatellia bacterium]